MNHQSSENESTHDFGRPLIQRTYRFFFERKPLYEDPWSPEDDAAAKHPAASKLCLRCLQPIPPAPQVWFCPNCGAATGDCNNSMPFLYIFSMGELLRRGVVGKPEKGFLPKLFLVFFSIGQYAVFAPIYWFCMYLKSIGEPIHDGIAPPPNLDSSDAESQEPPTPPQPSNLKQRAAALALSRAFSFCAIVVAGLLAGFVIIAAKERMEQRALQQKMPILRAYLAPLPDEQQMYSKALDEFLNPGGSDWLAAYSKSQDTLAAARAKIQDMTQSVANLVQGMDAKLNELNRWTVSHDTSSGMDMDTIRALRDLLQAEWSRMRPLRVMEIHVLARMDAPLELLQKNPDKWTLLADGSIEFKDTNLFGRFRSLMAEVNWLLERDR